jgi:hypothetical protein
VIESTAGGREWDSGVVGEDGSEGDGLNSSGEGNEGQGNISDGRGSEVKATFSTREVGYKSYHGRVMYSGWISVCKVSKEGFVGFLNGGDEGGRPSV